MFKSVRAIVVSTVIGLLVTGSSGIASADGYQSVASGASQVGLKDPDPSSRYDRAYGIFAAIPDSVVAQGPEAMNQWYGRNIPLTKEGHIPPDFWLKMVTPQEFNTCMVAAGQDPQELGENTAVRYDAVRVRATDPSRDLVKVSITYPVKGKDPKWTGVKLFRFAEWKKQLAKNCWHELYVPQVQP
jgi:hypothetical protein